MDHMIAEFLRERKEQWIKYSKWRTIASSSQGCLCTIGW
jgi:hypothetical protein